MNKNKFKKISLLGLSIFLITACGKIKTKEINEEYVNNAFKNHLEDIFGSVKYNYDISAFDSKSSLKEATGIVKANDLLGTKCTITGNKEENDSNYYVYSNCYSTIIENIESILANKYNFEINDSTDYDILANDIRSYSSDFKELLSEYKDSNTYSSYFNDDFSYIKLKLIINNNIEDQRIYIDNHNNLVILDTSSGFFSWRGEISLEDYLKLLKDNSLEEKIKEIQYSNYGY